MVQTLEEILERCTVKIKIPSKSGWGTGFFVDSDLILTCAHVVKGATSEPIQVYWQNQEAFEAAVIEEIYSDPFDIALLRLSSVSNKFSCVYLDTDIRSSDVFYAFGYPDDFENGAPVTFECEGITGDEPPLIKFKRGQARPGLSGSPLLNKRTGRVCGIVKFTRDRATDLGGGGIAVETALTKFSSLRERQKEFHEKDKRWSDALSYYFGKTLEIKSDVGIDYKPLQQFLENGDWMKADGETVELFFRITNTDYRNIPDIGAIKRFPCSDLRTIDCLWTTYSRKHFGFSTQQQIWGNIEEKSGNSHHKFLKFANQIGWLPDDYDFEKGYLGGLFEGKNNLEADLSYPEGFLPTVGFLLPMINWATIAESGEYFNLKETLGFVSTYASVFGKFAGPAIKTWLRVRSFDQTHYLNSFAKSTVAGTYERVWQLYGEHSIALMQRLRVCQIKV